MLIVVFIDDGFIGSIFITAFANSSSFWSQNIYNSMKSQSVVSMTGFVYDPQQQAYKQMIVDLKLRLAPKLSEETEVLIVNDVTTEKYKIARTYEPPIACVTIDWLIDSHRKNKKLPVDKYKIEKLFHGAHVKILDFDQQKSKRLQAKLTENGAIVKVLKSNAELKNNEERISVLLTTAKNFANLKCFMHEIQFPIVGLEWLENSLRAQLCKFPKDYALNLYYTSLPNDHSDKMKSKLNLQLAREPAFPHDHLFLQGTIIYLAENIRPDLSRLLKRLIAVLGGFFVDDPSPVVTHILTDSVTENEGAQLAVFGALVYLVRVEWLIDSIYLNKRMSQEDYFIRSFKPKVPHTTLPLDDNTNHQNSMSLNASLPLMPRKSISLPTPVPIKVKAKKFLSTIFRDCKFYIESTQKKQVELSQLTTKLKNNSGTVFQSRAHIQHGHCYYVLKDSPSCIEMIQRLKSDTKGHVQVQPVSYRWINQCLAKGQFIDPLRNDSYVYKPFNFKTPVMGFYKMVFDLLDIGDVARLRLKELYNTLGSVKNSPNRSEVTHCLCGEKYRESQRYKQYKKEGHNPKFIDWRWLIQCVNAARIIEIDKYLLQGENSPENTQSPPVQNSPEITA